jgi:hypothetical protein
MPHGGVMTPRNLVAGTRNANNDMLSWEPTCACFSRTSPARMRRVARKVASRGASSGRGESGDDPCRLLESALRSRRTTLPSAEAKRPLMHHDAFGSGSDGGAKPSRCTLSRVTVHSVGVTAHSVRRHSAPYRASGTSGRSSRRTLSGVRRTPLLVKARLSVTKARPRPTFLV